MSATDQEWAADYFQLQTIERFITCVVDCGDDMIRLTRSLVTMGFTFDSAVQEILTVNPGLGNDEFFNSIFPILWERAIASDDRLKTKSANKS